MRFARLKFRHTALGWRWVLYATNGLPIAMSVVFYTRKRDALRGWRRTMREARLGAIVEEEP